MESETKKDFSTPSTTDSGVITKMSSSGSGKTVEDFQKIGQQVKTFMQEFPEFWEEFWSNYKLPIVVFGFLLALIILLKVLFAVLGAINDLPLLAPTFEFIGIVYVGWFIFRYLLRGTSRQELGDNINSVKSQVLGGGETVLDRLSSKSDD